MNNRIRQSYRLNGSKGMLQDLINLHHTLHQVWVIFITLPQALNESVCRNLICGRPWKVADPEHRGNFWESRLWKTQQGLNKIIDQLFNPVLFLGISTYADKPQNASDYIYPLLRHAANHIPKSKHSETPLYILATAGMRLLPKVKQDAILNNLIENIPLRFDFLFSSTHVEVITGKQEGKWGLFWTCLTRNVFDRDAFSTEKLYKRLLPNNDWCFAVSTYLLTRAFTR